MEQLVSLTSSKTMGQFPKEIVKWATSKDFDVPCEIYSRIEPFSIYRTITLLKCIWVTSLP